MTIFLPGVSRTQIWRSRTRTVTCAQDAVTEMRGAGETLDATPAEGQWGRMARLLFYSFILRPRGFLIGLLRKTEATSQNIMSSGTQRVITKSWAQSPTNRKTLAQSCCRGH